MDRTSIVKRAFILLLALCLAVALTGCRTRTGVTSPAPTAAPADTGREDAGEEGAEPADAADVPPDAGEPDGPDMNEAGGRTKENPEASRKEYDENAPAEIVPGTDRLLHGEGEGGGAGVPAAEDAAATVDRLDEQAEDPATQTVAAEEAEEMGVAEDAEQADSAMTYYTVLLQDRMGSLYECQRANVYWETAEDHVTVHKTSAEHALILDAGAYDVSARLLPENLRVDDGWVVRKNPQVIVKVVDSGVLGGSVHSTASARTVYEALCAREGWTNIDAVRNRQVVLLSGELLDAPHLRLAAMLAVARTAYPELFADVDMDNALEMLAEEATGTLPSGIFWYLGE